MSIPAKDRDNNNPEIRRQMLEDSVIRAVRCGEKPDWETVKRIRELSEIIDQLPEPVQSAEEVEIGRLDLPSPNIEFFRGAMAAAFKLGHRTRVAKSFEGSSYLSPAIVLFAKHKTETPWRCDLCQTENDGLAVSCRNCEVDRYRPAEQDQRTLESDIAEDRH